MRLLLPLVASLSLNSLLAAQTAQTIAGSDRAPLPTFADVPALADLPARWRDGMEALAIPGLAVAVVRDGRVVAAQGFGVRNEQGDPVTPDTMFYIASATKPYTAAGLLLLVDDGRVDLDAPVRRYLPQLRLADDALASTITVRDLLCHRQGINRSAIVFRDAYTGQIDDDTYFELLGDATAVGQVDYTNVHFTLAGRVIEAVSGAKWQDFLAQRLFEPAGLERTTAYASRLYEDPNSARPMIRLDGKNRPSPVRKTDRTMHAAGGLGTTARDAARWLMLNLDEGRIGDEQLVSVGSMDEMHARQSTFPEPKGSIRIEQGFGLGWQHGSYRGRHEPMLMHGGGYIGTAAYMAMMPEKDFGLVVMSNSGDGGGPMTAVVMIDVFDRFLGEKDHEDLLETYAQMAPRMLATRTSPEAPRLDAEGISRPVAAYTGTFANEVWGTVEISSDRDGALIGRFGDLTFDLYARDAADGFTAFAVPGLTSAGRFTVEDDVVTSVVFTMFDDSEGVFTRTPVPH